MTSKYWTILIVAVIFITGNYAGNRLYEEKAILNSLLGKESNYDPNIRPQGNNSDLDSPVVVTTNIYVRQLRLDENKQTMTVQLIFRQEWKDIRLSYSRGNHLGRYISTNTSQVWIPDTFFSNEIESHFHNVVTPNEYVRIFNNGDVLLSLRVTVTLSCLMDLSLYPYDQQRCSIIMASYSKTTTDLIFLWKEESPVQINKELGIKSILTKYETDYCNSKTNTGEYSCIKVDLHFRRPTENIVRSVYIPTAILVVMTCLSLWLPTIMRTPIIHICLLGNAVITGAVWLKTPACPASMLITWLEACLALSVTALLQSKFIEYNEVTEKEKELKKPNRLYSLAKLLLPISFIVFNVIFWPVTFASIN